MNLERIGDSIITEEEQTAGKIMTGISVKRRIINGVKVESSGGLKLLRKDQVEQYTTHVSATIILVFGYAVTLFITGLAGLGLPPFTRRATLISLRHHTCITPALYTFAVWGLIVVLIMCIIGYAVTLLFRKENYIYSGAISVPFMLSLIMSFALNMTWLFAWDTFFMSATFVLLVLLMSANIAALSFMVCGFSESASFLRKNFLYDFWSNIMAINGMGLYAAWTVFIGLVNMAIYLQYVAHWDPVRICVGSLIFLSVAYLTWFAIENIALASVANPLMSHYLLYIWAMVGVYVEQADTAPLEVVRLIVMNFILGCVLLVSRIGILVKRRKVIYGEM